MTVYYKMRQIFLFKCNSYFITKCDSYYKMQRLLQIATVQKSNNEFYFLSYLNFQAGFRSSYSQMFFKTPVLESIFNKGLKACKFNKKIFQHRSFPANIVKYLRTLFFKEHVHWLPLKFQTLIESYSRFINNHKFE